MEIKQLEIDEKYVGMRLDEVVSSFVDITRSHAKNLIEQNNVLLNGKIKKAGEKLKLGDIIEIKIPDAKPLEASAEDIPLDIVYENEDFAIINKPQGLVVHPANGNHSGTLVNSLLFNLKNLSSINGVIRPGIVHRIDKDTSGLLVVAKNDNAHINLAKQIETKVCHRYYLALVFGNVKQEQGEICTHISRSKKDRKKMAVCDDNEGKIAISQYRVLKHYGSDYSLLEFKLQTGRTHQIRVHCAYINHAIVGDELYGRVDKKLKSNGQFLHAYKLELLNPKDNSPMIFTCQPPENFENALQKLNKIYYDNM